MTGIFLYAGWSLVGKMMAAKTPLATMGRGISAQGS